MIMIFGQTVKIVVSSLVHIMFFILSLPIIPTSQKTLSLSKQVEKNPICDNLHPEIGPHTYLLKDAVLVPVPLNQSLTCSQFLL